MIATPKAPANPWDQTPTAAADPTKPAVNPWDAPPGITPTPVPTTPAATQPAGAPATGSPVASPAAAGSPATGSPAGGAGAIQQLPDGVGGAVTVPPIALAPSSVVPPASGNATGLLGAAHAAQAAAGQYGTNPVSPFDPQDQMQKLRDVAAASANNAIGNGAYDPSKPESRSNVNPNAATPWATPGLIQPSAEAAANGAYATQTSPVAQTANMGPEKFAAWSAQFPGGVAPQWALQMLDKSEQDQFGNGHGGGNASGVGSVFSTPTAAAPDWAKGAPPGGVPQAGSSMSLAEMDAANTARSGTPAVPGAASPITTPVGPSDATPWNPASPATAPAPGSPAAPWSGPATQPFDASSNLVGTQINPVTGKRTVDLQGLQDTALGKVVNGPDRLALAKQYYDAFKTGTEADYQHAQTDATNAAAEHGYLGSGRLTNRYGDLEATRESSLKAKELGYLTDAATGTIADNHAAYADSANAAGTSAAQDAQHQADLRGERGYQAQQAAQAVAERAAQQQAEQQAQQQSFTQALQTYLAGNQNNPTGTYETAAGQATSEAGGQSADVAALMKLIASMGGGGG